MFKSPYKVLFLLVILAFTLAIISIPENLPIKFSLGSLRVDRVLNPPIIDISLLGARLHREFHTKYGLDLAGGTHLALEADMTGIPETDKLSALESAKEVIERRVNFFGVSEPVVQTAFAKNSYRILVDLPGVTNVEDAIALIGQTAQLEFREFTSIPVGTTSGFIVPTRENTKSVEINGKDLKRASVSFSGKTGEPEVAIQFSSDGAKKFAEVTGRLIGKQLAIFLDEYPITWPTVQTAITDGQAVITGSFTQEGAKMLALQLNAGALPVPVSVIEKRTVGATLGQESITMSVRAGLIGLLFVVIFMIAQYGGLGFAALIGLCMYALISFALYRLIPIVLTLPGIAGFILSVGMAVDSNILIFERFKEERRLGRPWSLAMESAFGKAWDSIRDANVTTLMVSAILFNPFNWSFLPSSGLVRGFALTLALGVFTSLFTGIVVTRTILRVFYSKGNK